VWQDTAEVHLPEAQTESAESTYVPSIDDVCTRAYRRAGLVSQLQSLTTIQAAQARGLLSDIADALQAEGVLMRAVQYGYVTLVQGQNVYSMAENIIDLVGNGSYIMPTDSQVPFQATSETVVIKKDRDTWQELASKGSQAQPTLYYFAREAPRSTLYLWPTPSAAEAGGQIRFQQHQTRPDLTNGNNTLPFERYWTDYFVWELAHVLAVDNSLDMARVALLSSRATTRKASAKAYSKQNVGMQAAISHPTGWARRRR
jgi:hypothetical protein